MYIYIYLCIHRPIHILKKCYPPSTQRDQDPLGLFSSIENASLLVRVCFARGLGDGSTWSLADVEPTFQGLLATKGTGSWGDRP